MQAMHNVYFVSHSFIYFRTKVQEHKNITILYYFATTIIKIDIIKVLYNLRSMFIIVIFVLTICLHIQYVCPCFSKHRVINFI